MKLYRFIGVYSNRENLIGGTIQQGVSVVATDGVEHVVFSHWTPSNMETAPRSRDKWYETPAEAIEAERCRLNASHAAELAALDAVPLDIAAELIRADSERSQALAAERAALRGSSPAPASPGLEK